MSKQSKLTDTPPYPVEQALRTLGANLRTARLRRNLSLDAVGRKIGSTRQRVAEAEQGKPGVSISMYVAMMWVFGMVDQVAELADPGRDSEGLALANHRERRHSGASRGLSDDF